MSKVAVLLPAYNEEVSIASMVLLSLQYADEVIVIDDGSSDRTSEVSRLAGATVLSHTTNKGKGAALKTGFKYAQDYDIIVTIDADGQHNPSEIPDVIKPIMEDRADIVNGSRYIAGKDTTTPTYRRVGQTVLDNATYLASGVKLTDTQSGFRAFSSKSIEYFNFDPNGFGIESDMLIEASVNKLRIVEVEITVRYDVNTTTDNPIVQGFSVLMRILELMRFNRPLYFYGISGSIVLFLGILIILTVKASLFTNNIYISAIGYFIVVMGLFLLFFGLFSDTVNRFKK
ncbi:MULTISPECIES: glycosyltransferase family 2 protein [Methanosphaera]|uniref:Predicted glycosyltransferase n=3 Tax=Methanosphaera stadtmanae TaxID=2317 RepID=Q2NFM6_METST|nr:MULTISPECIES: glycosyltransferase family 2 protein [Methanosphaera]ABC57377.1 predicted glycosyltransferase [Methanosphaera stadtmanae DSM 3091]OEC93509.1 glycosyl hydrolase [Methanosphaera sp. A6]RAP02921.1 glycosyl hydrolase [Methanosphaera stadtmanae]RAP47062.1 MAG: glycosyl hydrolase [Methanosphaera sp. DEW79]